MTRIAHLACVVAAASTAPFAPARAQAAPVAQQDPWSELSIKSAVLDEDRRVLVAVPEGYAASTRRYPVLVMLDADDTPQFKSALTTTRFLASRRAIPPLIVVGITNGRDRSHDMTPPLDTAGMARFPTAGGASRFLEFITREAMPEVRSRYRTAEFTVFSGHSFGGLFGLWVAATRPGTFPAVIALSPSLWWNDSTVVAPYADSIASAGARLRLFVANGGHEPGIDRPTARFNALLDGRPAPSITFGHTRFPSASHGLVPMPGLAEGLQFVFQPLSLAVTRLDDSSPFAADSAQFVDIFREIERGYNSGVRSFPGSSLGMTDTLPEGFIRQFAGAVLYIGRMPGAAAVVLGRAIELFPRSVRTRVDLAQALLAAADTGRARAELTRAAELASGDSTLAKLVDDEIRKLGGAGPRPLLRR